MLRKIKKILVNDLLVGWFYLLSILGIVLVCMIVFGAIEHTPIWKTIQTFFVGLFAVSCFYSAIALIMYVGKKIKQAHQDERSNLYKVIDFIEGIALFFIGVCLFWLLYTYFLRLYTNHSIPVLLFIASCSFVGYSYWVKSKKDNSSTAD